MPSMPIEFCLPKSGKAVPSGPDWLHEVKYDGYRLRVERHGDQVKLTSRGGLDWTRRFPWIAETARKIRKTQFVIDGEAVVLGVDGISDFNALHSRKHDHKVQLYAFTWRSAGTICAGCRCTCARPTWRSCCAGD
jgi:bifunctional non-homologous end joining protein LigD